MPKQIRHTKRTREGPKVMRITVDRDVLAKAVGLATSWASTQPSAPIHHQGILLVTESGNVTLTAESSSGAIEVYVPDAEAAPGRREQVLVYAHYISTVLEAIPSGQEVSLFTEEGENGSKDLVASSGPVHTVMRTLPSGKGDPLPQVGDIPEGASVKVQSDELAEAWSIGSVAYDKVKQYPVLQGVLAQVISNGTEPSVLRFMSSDTIAVTWASAPLAAGIKDDLPEEFVHNMDPVVMGKAVDLTKDGKLAEMVSSQDGHQVHILVFSDEEGEEQIYHIRCATRYFEKGKYPSAKMESQLQALIPNLGPQLEVDKLELLRVLRNAARIGSLDQEANGGQAEQVRVVIDGDSLTVSTEGNAEYEDSIKLVSWTGPRLSFIIKWGLYGAIITSYPGSGTLKGVIINKEDDGKSTPRSILLFTDWDPEEDRDILPMDYIGVVNMGEARYSKSQGSSSPRASTVPVATTEDEPKKRSRRKTSAPADSQPTEDGGEVVAPRRKRTAQRRVVSDSDANTSNDQLGDQSLERPRRRRASGTKEAVASTNGSESRSGKTSSTASQSKPPRTTATKRSAAKAVSSTRR